MAELLFVQFVDWSVELFEDLEAGRRNASLDNAAVLCLPLPRDEAALFHAVEEAGQVGVARDHAIADALAGKAVGSSAAQDAQDVVLSAGQAVLLDQVVGLLAEAIGDAQQGDKEPGLEAAGGAFRSGKGLHEEEYSRDND